MPDFPHKYLFKPVSASTLKKKREAGLCISHGCRNYSSSGKGGRCNTCKSRLYRINSPKRYTFNMVKESAHKRKIPFELSFEEFLKFDAETGYCDKVGREPHSLTIDRIKSELPYRADNIRVLTWEANCAKKVEGMTETWEPIAKALHMFSGSGSNWRSFRKIANDIEEQQRILNDAVQPPPVEKFDENCPF